MNNDNNGVNNNPVLTLNTINSINNENKIVPEITKIEPAETRVNNIPTNDVQIIPEESKILEIQNIDEILNTKKDELLTEQPKVGQTLNDIIKSQSTNEITNSELTNNQQENNLVQPVQPVTQSNNQIPQQTQPLVEKVPEISDDELLMSFIGPNYEKITTKPINFSGLFFSSFYMFYRKMFLYGLIFFLIQFALMNIIDNAILNIIPNILVGLFINKLYVSNAIKKVQKIKSENPIADYNTLNKICSSKGGTSTGQLILGTIVSVSLAIAAIIIMIINGIGGAFIDILDFVISEQSIKEENKDNETIPEIPNDSNVIEDAEIGSTMCAGTTCSFQIMLNSEYVQYQYKANNVNYFRKLDDYKDYIKIDVYYKEQDIVGYKVYIKSTNEEITNITNVNDLRSKLGLYSIGTNTDTLTLNRVDMTGAGFSNNDSYMYTDYIFTNKDGNEFKMRYKFKDQGLKLEEAKQYTVTFEVEEGTFDIKYNITSIN